MKQTKPTNKIENTQDDQKGFKFFAAIGRFSIRFRWLVVIVWFVGSGLIVHNLPSLSSVTQSNNSNFLPTSAPSEKAAQLANAFGRANNSEPIPVVIATNNGQPLSISDQTAIASLQAKLSKVSGVHQILSGGVSADGQADELVILSSQGGGFDPTPFITSLRSTIKSADLPSDLQAHLAGEVATAVDNSTKSGSTNKQLELGSVIFIILLLVFIFRAPLAPIVTLIAPGLVVTIAGPVVAEAAHHGLKVSSLAQLLLTVLVLGAGTDYGLFLIFRVREELQNGLGKNEAIVKALSRVGESITFSAATVIAALLSLLLATFQIYSNLGLPLAIGIAIMLLAGLTLLPALLAIFGRAVFWPSKKYKKPGSFGLWGKICASVVQRPVPVLVIGIIFFGGLALAVPGYKAGGFAGQTTSPAGTDSADGNAILAKHFPSSSANPTAVLFVFPYSVWQKPAVLASVQSQLEQDKQFKSVTGPLSPNGIKLTPAQLVRLHQILGSPKNLSTGTASSVTPNVAQLEVYKNLANYISSDGHTVDFATALTAGDPGGTPAMAAVPAIRSSVTKIAQASGATNSGVAGEAPALYDINRISNNDLIRIVPVAIVVIGLILGLLMRSLVAPLYLVASVALSYLASLGMAVLIFIDIAHGSGIEFILPFLMFLFLLALGEDYNIIVMTRVREEAHNVSLKKAVTQALNTTGTTVTSAGLVLAGTFGVLAVVGGNGNSQVRDIGVGLSLGILMDTFLVRTLIVPAIVVLLGKWNWWPSKHGSWVEQD